MNCKLLALFWCFSDGNILSFSSPQAAISFYLLSPSDHTFQSPIITDLIIMINSLSEQLQTLHTPLTLIKAVRKGQDFSSQQLFFIREQKPSQKVSPPSSLPFRTHWMELGHMPTLKPLPSKGNRITMPWFTSNIVHSKGLWSPFLFMWYQNNNNQCIHFLLLLKQVTINLVTWNNTNLLSYRLRNRSLKWVLLGRNQDVSRAAHPLKALAKIWFLTFSSF